MPLQARPPFSRRAFRYHVRPRRLLYGGVAALSRPRAAPWPTTRAGAAKPLPAVVGKSARPSASGLSAYLEGTDRQKSDDLSRPPTFADRSRRHRVVGEKGSRRPFVSGPAPHETGTLPGPQGRAAELPAVADLEISVEKSCLGGRQLRFIGFWGTEPPSPAACRPPTPAGHRAAFGARGWRAARASVAVRAARSARGRRSVVPLRVTSARLTVSAVSAPTLLACALAGNCWPSRATRGRFPAVWPCPEGLRVDLQCVPVLPPPRER